MSELPDTEKWRRHFDAAALHHKVREVDLKSGVKLEGTTRKRLRARLREASFDHTERHGDRLFARIGEHAWLLLHLGGTARLACLKGEDPAPEDTCVLIRFADGRQVACSCRSESARIGLVESPQRYAQEHDLGPDALSHVMPLSDFRDTLRERHDPVKSVLMDQRFIAGIGDTYSDEMLFQARIHPSAEASSLKDSQVAALYAAVTRVLHIAIGSSGGPEQLPSTWLLPHRTRDGLCPRCNNRLERLAVAGHATFCCPRCQRMGKGHSRA